MIKRSSSKQTTFKESLEIVPCALTYGTDYLVAAKKYTVSYQQVYNWIKKYKKSGITGLQDKRENSQAIDELSELDHLRIEKKIP